MQDSMKRMKSLSFAMTEEDNFFFSRKFVTVKPNVRQDGRKLQKTQRSTSASFPKLPSIEKIRTLSTDIENTDFLPNQVELPLRKSSSSLSSEFSGWREYSLPILYPNLESDKENKQRIIESKWGRGTALDIGLWEDSIAPVVKVRSRVDIDLGMSEVTDVLTDEMVGACSSFLAKSPETELYVENKCELVNMGLRDIFILQYRHYLQYIDLENNSVGDLTPLGGIPYLMYLNAARNKLRDVLRFKPPWCLTYVNLAYNNISKIDDLSEFWSIVRLDLSHNVIERIEGLVNLRHLRFLNLGYNIIESIENLDNLDIQELNLEYNCISNFRSATSAFGISTLPNLRTLILRHNKLTTLEFFEGAYGLRYIDLKYNKISDLLEVSHLKSLVHEIDFRGNPCTNWPNYRDVLLFSMPSVMFVDGASVTISEKVSASTIFAPPIELVVASSVTKLMLLEHLNTIDIDLHITPIDQSTPPLIILTGPPAVKKSILAKKIANDLPKRVRYCLSHTTKHQPYDDPLGSTYHFVSREEFNEITRRGEFLSTREWLGNSYGFHVSEIKALALDKKIGITHMDLHAALQMQSRYVNAKLILVLTKSVELHRLWIQEKIQIFTWVKSSLQNLVTFKLEKYRRPTIEMKESMSTKVNFIYELLNEVLETLDSSPSSTTMGSEATEEMNTVMVMESQTTLPEIIKTSSDIEMEKKHITFQGEDEQSTTAPSSKVTFNSDKLTVPMPDELKVILDEHSNVIIENEEERRRRLKEKIRLQHDLLRLQMDNDEFVEGENLEDYSASSDDLFVSKRCLPGMDSPKLLEKLHSKLVTKSREQYFEQHLNSVGCISLAVFTDNLESAYNQVVDFVYEFYISQPSRKSKFSMEIQKLMEAVNASKTKTFLQELEEYKNYKLSSNSNTFENSKY